jgi:hypothetical protein
MAIAAPHGLGGPDAHAVAFGEVVGIGDGTHGFRSGGGCGIDPVLTVQLVVGFECEHWIWIGLGLQIPIKAIMLRSITVVLQLFSI